MASSNQPSSGRSSSGQSSSGRSSAGQPFGRSRSATSSSPRRSRTKSSGSPSTAKVKAKKLKVGLSLTPESAQVLDQMAKAANLSRSALVEQLASGQLLLTSNGATQGFQLTVTADPQAHTVTDIQAIAQSQLTPRSQPGAAPDPQPTITAQDLDNLQQTIATQQQTIATLEQQLAHKAQAIAAAAELARQKETIALAYETEKAELAHQKEAAALAYETEKAELAHQKEAAALAYETEKAELTRKTEAAELAAKAAHTALAVEIATLQQTLTTQRQTIAALQQQRDQCQIEYTRQQHESVTLQHNAQQQAELIQTLQQQSAHLRQIASIGESHLNKWRHRSYSH